MAQVKRKNAKHAFTYHEIENIIKQVEKDTINLTRDMRDEFEELKDTQQRTKIELVNLKTGVTVNLIVFIAAMVYFLTYWLFGEVVHKVAFTVTILSGFALLMHFWFMERRYI